MARYASEVQADIAVMRRVIERELDALHRRLPGRWWLVYARLGGGLGAGLMLSRAPLLKVLGSALRLAELGLGLAATAQAMERLRQRSFGGREEQVLGDSGQEVGERWVRATRLPLSTRRACAQANGDGGVVGCL